MLLDKPLRLCHGAGNGIDKACLMTATNMLRGRPEARDGCDSCTCMLLARFIVCTNDTMRACDRHEVYGPLPWEIMGTYTEDPKVLLKRARVLVDGCRDMLQAPYCDAQSYIYMDRAEGYLRHAADGGGGSLQSRLVSAVTNATSALCASSRGGSHALYEGGVLGRVLRYTTAPYKSPVKTRVGANRCRNLILEVCKIGDKRPVELKMTPSQLSTALA